MNKNKDSPVELERTVSMLPISMIQVIFLGRFYQNLNFNLKCTLLFRNLSEMEAQGTVTAGSSTPGTRLQVVVNPSVEKKC